MTLPRTTPDCALPALSREQRKALVAEVMAENHPRLIATLSVVAAAMQNAGLANGERNGPR